MINLQNSPGSWAEVGSKIRALDIPGAIAHAQAAIAAQKTAGSTSAADTTSTASTLASATGTATGSMPQMVYQMMQLVGMMMMSMMMLGRMGSANSNAYDAVSTIRNSDPQLASWMRQLQESQAHVQEETSTRQQLSSLISQRWQALGGDAATYQNAMSQLGVPLLNNASTANADTVASNTNSNEISVAADASSDSTDTASDTDSSANSTTTTTTANNSAATTNNSSSSGATSANTTASAESEEDAAIATAASTLAQSLIKKVDAERKRFVYKRTFFQ